MKIEDFKQLVSEFSDQYAGVKAPSETQLAAMEATLGFKFPESLRWLLTVHGYANATGVDSLEGSIGTTLACRETIGLPEHWLILNEWGDAGVVMLDSDSGRCCWCGSHDVERIARGKEPLTSRSIGSTALRNGRNRGWKTL